MDQSNANSLTTQSVLSTNRSTPIIHTTSQCIQYPCSVNTTTPSGSADEQGKTDDLALKRQATGNTVWDKPDNKGEFICATCNKVFTQRALLLKHRVMHDEPKHVCETCGRSFVREDKLKRHVMSIHTTEKPHVCPICSKAFSRK